MNRHLRAVSKPRVALAQSGTPGFNFDLVSFLQFVVTILVAVNGLLTRKAMNTTA